MFTLEHIIWIVLCIIFVIAMMMIAKYKNMNLKKAGLVMSIIALISEISKILSNMEESVKGGMHLDPGALPFHLCSLMIFVVIYITFAKENKFKKLLINFTSVMGVLGSFCAIMIPTNGTSFTSVLAYQCFVYHAGLLWFSLYLIVSKNATFSFKIMLQNMVMLLILVIFNLYVNSALSVYDVNFMYLTRPPMENLPILNLDNGWYAYLLSLLLVGLLLTTIFQLPFVLININRKNKEIKTE